MVRTLGALALSCLVGCGSVIGPVPDGSGGAPSGAATSTGGTGGAGPASGGSQGIDLEPVSSGGTPSLGLGGAVSAWIGGRDVLLDGPDPAIMTLDPASTEIRGVLQLLGGWSFAGLELLAHQDFLWALALRNEEAVLLVFHKDRCNGPVGQLTVPDELVRDRRLVLGEEALLSCSESDCILIEGVELDVRTTLPLGSLTWLERNGATLCAGDDERLICSRGDGVVSEPLLWREATSARGRLADVGNCAVFESSQVCMDGSGAWEETPLAIGPPPPPTCETLWHAGAFELTRSTLVEACAPEDGSPPPVAETRTACGSTPNAQNVTDFVYSSTCLCLIVG